MTDTTADPSLVGSFAGYVPRDPRFGPPWVDIDELRDRPRPHRYLHGGFEGTHTLFSIYLPSQEQFAGRLLQWLEGGSGGTETTLATGPSVRAQQYDTAHRDLGAILCESNQGHYALESTGFAGDIELFGASAETATFAKWLAPRLYGREVTRAYVYGGSGGGHRSCQCIMNCPDLYDGAVPFIFGVNTSIYWSIQGLALAVLGEEELRAIADATEPGGSGDPFAGLDAVQREVLADLYRMGYPRGAETQLWRSPIFAFPLHGMLATLPGYFEDFWTKKGFLGHDAPERLQRLIQHFTTTVRAPTPASALAGKVPVAIGLASGAITPETRYGALLDVPDAGKLFMARLRITTGKAAGREITVADIEGDTVLPFAERGPELFDGVEPGDEIEVDNRDWVAFCHYYRHAAEHNGPGPHHEQERVPAESRFLSVDGRPVHRQLPSAPYALDEVWAAPGKIIAIGAGLDNVIWPSFVTPFDRYLRRQFGESVDDHYRLWWIDNATHGDPEVPAFLTPEKDARVWRTRLVEYTSMLTQALRDVVAWVEDDVAPPRSTAYHSTVDGRLVLPARAADRLGVQAVVRLAVAGADRPDRASVAVGEPVTFEAFAEVPPGSGFLVDARLDLFSTDSWELTAAVDGSSPRLVTTFTHTFEDAGEYFPSFRVSSQRYGNKGDQARVHNLARVRVVVTG